MAVLQVKKYKTIKDENGNKIQVLKSKEEWNKETRKGTKTWYFSDRYKINNKIKQYKSSLFEFKREAEKERGLFLDDPINYIKEHSKKAKNKIGYIVENNDSKNLNQLFEDFHKYSLNYEKESTAYDHKLIWKNHISKQIGFLFPYQLNLSIIQSLHEFLNDKINPRTNKPYSTETKNTFHSTISSFLEYLKIKGLIEINYAKVLGGFKNIKVNKNIKKKIRYQTEEEFNRFISVVDDELWHSFFTFLFWHGCRKGEQRALLIEDIDFDNSTCHLHNTFSRGENGGEVIGPIKNGKERTIYLTEQSKKELEKLVNFYKQLDGYNEKWFLFGGPSNLYKNRIERTLNKYYKKLQETYPNEKINVLTHHEFGRHSHASYLLDKGLENGTPREVVYEIIAERLGDTVDVIKETYAHPYESKYEEKTKELLK